MACHCSVDAAIQPEHPPPPSVSLGFFKGCAPEPLCAGRCAAPFSTGSCPPRGRAGAGRGGAAAAGLHGHVRRARPGHPRGGLRRQEREQLP